MGFSPQIYNKIQETQEQTYETFEELNSAYGFDNPEKTRDDLTEEEERAYVNACFDLYEKIGFTNVFNSPYDEGKKYNGMDYAIIGRLDEKHVDLECLSMWGIMLENGEGISAGPEEICLAEKMPETYETFEELNVAYELDNPDKTRDDLTEEEERSYVDVLFDLYEKFGFKDTFESSDNLASIYNGLEYKILSRVNEDYAELEYLPMWHIQFENGKMMMAKPEEICIAENVPAE